MKHRFYLTLFTIVSISAAGKLYARNELLDSQFQPEFVSMPSSALADGTFSALLNPANLYRLDRIGIDFATGPSVELNLLGASATVSRIGGVSAGILNFETVYGSRKRGLYVGWGREVLGSLAIGLAFKNVGADLFDFGGGILFDLGLTFHPNETVAPFFGRDFIRERVFISAVLQNVGAHGAYDADEDTALRLGFGYDIRELDTKIFVDKCFLSENSRLAFGLEIAPHPLPFLSLRLAYDMDALLVGVSITGDDLRVNAGYDAGEDAYYVGVSGSFEKTRAEISENITREGIAKYDEAVRLYHLPDDAGKLDSYRMMNAALDKFRLALFYDDGNTDAALNRDMVENALQDARSNNVRLGEESLTRRVYPSALVYFQRAAAIRRSPDVNARIGMLLTNDAVVSYIQERSRAIDQFMSDKKYLEARQKAIQLLWVNPYDRGVLRRKKEIERRLQMLAENLYREASRQYAAADFANCIANLQKALTYRPEYAQALKLLEQANKDYANIALLNQAKTSYQSGNYMSALSAVNKLLRADPRNEEAKQLKDKILAVLRANLNTYLSSGIELYNNNEYEKAIAEFDKVLAVEPYNGVATDYRNKAVSKLEAIRRYQSAGN